MIIIKQIPVFIPPLKFSAMPVLPPSPPPLTNYDAATHDSVKSKGLHAKFGKETKFLFSLLCSYMVKIDQLCNVRVWSLHPWLSPASSSIYTKSIVFSRMETRLILVFSYMEPRRIIVFSYMGTRRITMFNYMGTGLIVFIVTWEQVWIWCLLTWEQSCVYLRRNKADYSVQLYGNKPEICVSAGTVPQA